MHMQETNYENELGENTLVLRQITFINSPDEHHNSISFITLYIP